MNSLKNLLSNGVAAVSSVTPDRPPSPHTPPPPEGYSISTPNSTTALLSSFALNRSGSTLAARAPRHATATTCPLCFAVVPSEAAMRHLDECDALTSTGPTTVSATGDLEFRSFEAVFDQLEAAERRLTPEVAPDGAAMVAPPAAPLTSLEERLEAVAHQQAYWEKLERLQANGYLSPLVSRAVPTASHSLAQSQRIRPGALRFDDNDNDHVQLQSNANSNTNVNINVNVTVTPSDAGGGVPEAQRSASTLRSMLNSFRSVVRAKAVESAATKDAPVAAESADATVTALLSGVMVSTFEADPRLGFDSATHSRTLMFSGDESSAYSVGFEFDFVEHFGREFRAVRARFFGTAAEHSDVVASEVVYCQSLQSGLVRAASTGKSKADFFRTNDNRLLIKSIKEEEYNALLAVMDSWMEHVRENPSTLLVAVLGMYVVQTARTTVRYLAMENVGLGAPVLEVLDIKGSLVGRKTNERADAFEFELIDDDPAALVDDAPRAVNSGRKAKTANGGSAPLLKDVDLLERREQVFRFGPALREQFFDQLTKDATYLGAAHLMDYSLLVLVADPAQVAMHASTLPYAPSEWSVFRRFNGAVCGTDEHDRPLESVCYFMAIIDFAQPFNVRKRVESIAKSLVHDVNELSAVEPQFYATRLIQFAQRLSDKEQMQQQPIAMSASQSLLPDQVERI